MIYEDLKGKRVLVTGSSSGIGQAAAIMFAQQACFVGVHYFKTKEGGKKTLLEVKKYSDGILIRADMRSETQVNKMIKKFAEATGGIDILINNAGDLIERQSFEKATLEYHENIFATNCRSVFLAIKAAIKYLKKSKGCIVNISSLGAYTGGGGGSGLYAGAKAAILTETISIAAEFSKYGIRVNSVVPGLIETRFHQRYSSAERVKAMAAKTPLGRNGTPQDVAKAILFLASEEAAGFITGVNLLVNGGLVMRI